MFNMPRVLKYMRKILTETNDTLLVHCHAGVSRSTTLVACYLMFYENMSQEDAIAQVKRWRSDAFICGISFPRVFKAFT